MSNSLVTLPGGDYFYMHLRVINDKDHDVPCRIELRDDMTILDDPSKYAVGILSFTASLGASSLIFTPADSAIGQDRSAIYEHRFSNNADFSQVYDMLSHDPSGMIKTIARERRSLKTTSLSMTDMFDKINPSSKISQQTGCRFQLTADGRVQLSYVDPGFANTLLTNNQHAQQLIDNRDALNDSSHHTEVTLSKDLLDYFNMNGAPIERIRHNDTTYDELWDLLHWFAGSSGFYASWNEAYRYNFRVKASQVKTNRDSPNFFEILDYASNEITITDMGAWLSANNLAKSDLSGLSSENAVARALEICIYKNASREPVGSFEQWEFSVEDDELVLRCRGFLENDLVAGEEVRIDDPILRYIAGIYQDALTPAFKLYGITERDPKDPTKAYIGANEAPPGTYAVVNPFPVIHFNVAKGFDQLGSVVVNDNLVTLFNPKNQYARPAYHTTDRFRNLDRRILLTVLDRTPRVVDKRKYGATVQEWAATIGISPQPPNPAWSPRLGFYVGTNDDAGHMVNTLQDPSIPDNVALIPRITTKNYKQALGNICRSDAPAKNRIGTSFQYKGYYTAHLIDPVIHRTHDAAPFTGRDEVDEKNQDDVLHSELNAMENASSRSTPNMLFEPFYQAKFCFAYQTFGYAQISEFSLKTRVAADLNLAMHEKLQSVNGTSKRQVYSVASYYQNDPRRSGLAQQIRGEIVELLDNFDLGHVKPLPVADQETRLIQSLDPLSTLLLTCPPGEAYFFWQPGLTVVAKKDKSDVLAPNKVGQTLQIGTFDNNQASKIEAEASVLLGRDGSDLFFDKTVEFHFALNSAADVALRDIDFETNRCICRFGLQGDRTQQEGEVLSYSYYKKNGVRHSALTIWWTSLTPQRAATFSDDKIFEAPDKDTSTKRVKASKHHRNHANARESLVAFYLQVFETKDEVDKIVMRQGITQTVAKPNTPIRLFPGDRIRSMFPNVDSLQHFAQLAVVSNNGFLFRPEINQGFTSPVMLSVPLNLQLSTSLGPQMTISGVNVTPAADVYYSARGQPQMHPLTSNLPLRAGTLEIQMESRDGTERTVAMLKPKGRFDCRLFFMRKP